MILQQFISDAQIKIAVIYGEREANAIIYNLLDHVFGYSKADAILYAVDEIAPEKETILQDALVRLQKHEPIQHITGRTYFYDLYFEVDSNVLIPRPETEELVEWIIHSGTKTSPKILDIGTGSGCIAVTLAKNIEGAKVAAIDLSNEACNLAKKNSLHNEVELEVFNVDILNNEFPDKKFDVIVSNPPYIPQNEKQSMDDNVLNYEPELALFVSDEDPLLFYDKIADFAKDHLKRKGKLFFEIHENFGNDTLNLLVKKGYKEVTLRQDMQGKDRMIMAIK